MCSFSEPNQDHLRLDRKIGEYRRVVVLIKFVGVILNVVVEVQISQCWRSYAKLDTFQIKLVRFDTKLDAFYV